MEQLIEARQRSETRRDEVVQRRRIPGQEDETHGGVMGGENDVHSVSALREVRRDLAVARMRRNGAGMDTTPVAEGRWERYV
jgi:hypothetical protein